MTPLRTLLAQRIASRYFAALWGIYLVGISAMLRANRFYLDDLGRALHGYADWWTAARPLSELLSWLFYAGPVTLDASPLTQILAAGILALSSLLLLDVLRMRLSWWSALCTVPMGLSPYGLENLSYKFDAPGMALSLFLAILACRPSFHRSRTGLLCAALTLFASACLYQPGLNAYLAISLYHALTDSVSRKRIRVGAGRLCRFALPFVLGVGVYILQAPLWFGATPHADYINQHAAMRPLCDLPAQVAKNIPAYLRLLAQDWYGNGLGLFMALAALVFSASLVVRGLRPAHTPHRPTIRLRQVWRVLIMLALLPCFWLTPLGLQVFLQNPVWAPRTFLGFGVMLSLMLLHIERHAKGKIRRPFIRVVQGLVLWQLLIFAQLYGNLLDGQSRWELSRITLLASDLNRYIQETGSRRVTFIGSVGVSPLAKTPAARYPLLERLVSVPLTQTRLWGYEQLRVFGVNLASPPLTDELLAQPRTLFMKVPGYRIEKGPDNIGIVTFLPPPTPKPRTLPR